MPGAVDPDTYADADKESSPAAPEAAASETAVAEAVAPPTATDSQAASDTQTYVLLVAGTALLPCWAYSAHKCS